MRTTWTATFCLLLAACGAKQQPAEPAEPQVAISLTPSGLQPFPAGEVNQATLEAAFQGYNVAADDAGAHFAIRDGGDTIIHVEKSGDSYRVKVTGDLVEGPGGIRVGSEWSRIGQLADVQCRRGADPWTDQAFCTVASLPGIVFAFDISGVTTPGCTEACQIEDLSTMAGQQVRSMDWQP